MGLFQGDLINVPFANKEPGNLSFNKISSGFKMQEPVRLLYLSSCSKEILYIPLHKANSHDTLCPYETMCVGGWEYSAMVILVD